MLTERGRSQHPYLIFYRERTAAIPLRSSDFVINSRACISDIYFAFPMTFPAHLLDRCAKYFTRETSHPPLRCYHDERTLPDDIPIAETFILLCFFSIFVDARTRANRIASSCTLKWSLSSLFSFLERIVSHSIPSRSILQMTRIFPYHVPRSDLRTGHSTTREGSRTIKRAVDQQRSWATFCRRSCYVLTRYQ